MTILGDVKTLLRISSDAFDGEINDLTLSAIADLQLSGVHPSKLDAETDPLVKRAVSLYVKANFGWANEDSDKLQRSYELLKTHLTLSQEYTESEDE